MKILRTILCLVVGVALTGCLKESRYGTTCVLKPLVQNLSTDKATPMEGVVAYTFAADTTQWYIASYADAVAGVLTNRADHSIQRTEPDAVATAYTGPYAPADSGEELPGWEDVEPEKPTISTASWVQMELGKSIHLIVAIDTTHRIYGYTQQDPVLDMPWLFLSTVFTPWKESKLYKSGNWMFVNEFYEKPVILKAYCAPKIQSTEGGEEVEPASSSQIKAYAFAADTTEWRIASYDDAVAGKIVRKESPSESRTTPDFQAYREGSGMYGMSVSATPLFVVVVDRTDRIYAYTKQEPDLHGESPVWPLVFRTWITDPAREEEGWQFVRE